MGEMINTLIILVGKSEGGRAFGRYRSRCVGHIRMDRTEVGWEFVNWINLPQDKAQ
jgi:hypothetical protein